MEKANFRSLQNVSKPFEEAKTTKPTTSSQTNAPLSNGKHTDIFSIAASVA